MSNQHQIRMAKAPERDVESLLDFLRELEEQIDNYRFTDDELGKWVDENFKRINGKYERILNGFTVLVDNVCDPTLDYLDYNPDIKQAKQQVAYLRQLVRGDRSITDEDIDAMFSSWLKDSELNV